MRQRPPSKTGRKHGAIFAVIRTVGPTLGQFSWRDFPLHKQQTHSALNKLCELGEIRIVRRSIPGRYGQPATYTFNERPSASSPSS